jgi:hypothetical protein
MASPRRLLSAASIALATVLVSERVAAQTPDAPVAIVVKAGTSLRIVLERRLIVKRVGQPVVGTVAEDVYAHDRVVFPEGAGVEGHIDAFEEAPRAARLRAMIGGSFSSLRRAIVRFDTVVLDDGRRIAIDAVAAGNPGRVRRQIAAGAQRADPDPTGVVASVREEIEQRKNAVVAALDAIKEPGKIDRLKEMAIDRLPYHPQYFGKGAVFNASLVSPVGIGSVTPIAAAAAGTLPAPDTILNARLVTPLDSGKTPKGTPVEAVVTTPVFSVDHQLILAEGATLRGEVTLAATARHFRRNGRLRFLFESVQPPAQESQTLLASLYSVETGADDHVAVDEEGGARVENSGTRFIAPALALLALHATADPERRGFDNDADDGKLESPGVGARSAGGFLGWGLIGVALSQLSQPAAIAFAAVGAVRSVYSSFLAKGHEVSFAVDTPIQVRLAPGPSRAQ